jgi:Tfp pilus assembly protein PilX
MNRSFRNRRRGVTSVIAMLFLVLIGTLALGFYTSVTTATALAKNDRRTAKALMAAESGIQFMRNRLANVTIPPNTTSAQLLNELHTDLLADEQIAGNLLGAEIKRDGNVIMIPFICTDAVENSGFTVTISDIGSVGEVVCTVRGRSGAGSSVSNKGVRLDFTRAQIESPVFDSAVAARSKLVIKKGAVTGIPGVSSDAIIKLMSTMTSAPAITMTGGTIGSAAGGELYISSEHDVYPAPDGDGKADSGSVQLAGGSVHGTMNLTTIHNNYLKPVDAPEFPTVSTDEFAAYATNTYSGGSGGVLKNVRIPAGTDPKFSGNVTVQGILYIESPNVVEFGGNTNMQGFIVFENAGTSSVNQIISTGNFTYGNLPADTEFDNLRTITGISMLAPTTSVKFTGSVDSEIRGNMILGRFENAGSADLQIEQGSILAMDQSGDGIVLNGKTVKFASTGGNFPPSAGVSYTSRFLPTKGSYLELN